MLQIFTAHPEEKVKALLQPRQLFLLILAGWVNRQQQHAIEYLLTENNVLRQKLGKKRILLNDDQRRRLAVKGKILGRGHYVYPRPRRNPSIVHALASRMPVDTSLRRPLNLRFVPDSNRTSA